MHRTALQPSFLACPQRVASQAYLREATQRHQPLHWGAGIHAFDSFNISNCFLLVERKLFIDHSTEYCCYPRKRPSVARSTFDSKNDTNTVNIIETKIRSQMVCTFKIYPCYKQAQRRTSCPYHGIAFPCTCYWIEPREEMQTQPLCVGFEKSSLIYKKTRQEALGLSWAAVA